MASAIFGYGVRELEPGMEYRQLSSEEKKAMENPGDTIFFDWPADGHIERDGLFHYRTLIVQSRGVVFDADTFAQVSGRNVIDEKRHFAWFPLMILLNMVAIIIGHTTKLSQSAWFKFMVFMLVILFLITTMYLTLWLTDAIMVLGMIIVAALMAISSMVSITKTFTDEHRVIKRYFFYTSLLLWPLFIALWYNLI
jgi:hypothetical protein